MDLLLNANSVFMDVPMAASSASRHHHHDDSSSSSSAVTLMTGLIRLKSPACFEEIASPDNPRETPWPEEFIEKLESTSVKYQKRKDDRYHLCIHVIDVQAQRSSGVGTYSKEVKVRVHGFLTDMLEELDSGKFVLKLQIGTDKKLQLDCADIPVSSKVALGPTPAHNNVCLRKEKYFEGYLPSGSAFHEYDIPEMTGFINVILSRDKMLSAERGKMLGICRKILEHQIQTDMIIVASDGKEFGCNKSFLAAHSPVFAAMFDRREMKEVESGKIEMVDMNGADVRAFLKYLYYMDVTAPREKSSIALSLLKAGHKYDIPQLEKEMKEIFSWKPAIWCDVQVALELFLFARQLDEYDTLKTKALEVLKLKADDFSIKLLTERVLGNMKLAAEVMFEIFQLMSSSVDTASNVD